MTNKENEDMVHEITRTLGKLVVDDAPMREHVGTSNQDGLIYVTYFCVTDRSGNRYRLSFSRPIPPEELSTNRRAVAFVGRIRREAAEAFQLKAALYDAKIITEAARAEMEIGLPRGPTLAEVC